MDFSVASVCVVGVILKKGCYVMIIILVVMMIITGATSGNSTEKRYCSSPLASSFFFFVFLPLPAMPIPLTPRSLHLPLPTSLLLNLPYLFHFLIPFLLSPSPFFSTLPISPSFYLSSPLSFPFPFSSLALLLHLTIRSLNSLFFSFPLSPFLFKSHFFFFS